MTWVVLFVHGMGQSAEGETLVRFGEALRASVARHLEPAEPADPKSKVDVTVAWLSSLDSDQPARAELKIRGCQGATLASGVRVGSEFLAVPAPGVPVDSRWLLAEAWWAKKFPTPTYKELASWSCGVLPFALIAHFDRRFRRVLFASERSWRSAHSPQNVLRALGLLLLEGIGLLLALGLLTPLMLVAIVFLLLLGLVPATRDLAGALQRRLAESIGDCYVFRDQPIAAAAICTSVRERLEWLATRCHKVAVVAHSQGGAISHKVLHGTLTAPCDLLITFGSGLAKLSELGRSEVFGGQVWLVFAVVGGALAWLGFLAFVVLVVLGWASQGAGALLYGGCAFLIIVMGMIGLFFSIAIRSSDKKGDPITLGSERSKRAHLHFRWAMCWGFVFALSVGVVFSAANTWWTFGLSSPWQNVLMAFVLAFGLALAYGALSAWHVESGRSADPREQWKRDRVLFVENFNFHNRDLKWDDLYASADPVPNGQLLDLDDGRSMSSTRVLNTHSLLRDHTSVLASEGRFCSAGNAFFAGVGRAQNARSRLGSRRSSASLASALVASRALGARSSSLGACGPLEGQPAGTDDPVYRFCVVHVCRRH